MIVGHNRYKAVSQETITVDDTAGGKPLTSTKITPQVEYALCQVLTAAIRVTLDGTPPVAATTGFLFNTGEFFEVWGHGDLLALRAIRDTGTSGVLEVTYFGRGAA